MVYLFHIAASSRRKDKSLRIMSQKFVMLFLVSKTQTVTLDTAAKILIEEGQDESSHSKYKSKTSGILNYTEEHILYFYWLSAAHNLFHLFS